MIIQLHIDEMRGTKPILEPTSGVFILGGAIRQWFSGEDASDVDIFGESEEKLKTYVVNELLPIGYKEVSKNPLTTTYSNGLQLVQVMFGKPFANIEAAFNEFDFHICQFGYSVDGIFATKKAILGVLRNHLSINKISKEFAVDSLRRAFKYQKKGYIPCNGTIRDLSLSFQNLTPEEINNQVIISPNGGKRIIRFD